MYPKYMKTVILIIAMFLLGCTQDIERSPDGLSCTGTRQKIVAVIDTGYGFGGLGNEDILCKTGHKDFSSDKEFADFDTEDPVPLDKHGHGTNIAGTIEKFAGKSNYCLVIIKYFSPEDSSGNNVKHTILAIKWATKIGADIINYSGGGKEEYGPETKAVKEFLDKGGKFIAAAGNEHSDLSVHPYYPAQDDPRVVSVGNLDSKGHRNAMSNYGSKVTRWEIGTQTIYGIKMTGTSQAAAVATGKTIRKKMCKISVDTDSK